MSSPYERFYLDGHLFVDLRQQQVMLDGQMLTLSDTEFRLLAVLMEHAGEVVPRPLLLMRTRTVDLHIRRLGRKLGTYADQYIETVHGVGYRFRPMPWTLS
jgi:DNA-binding response OmpR family regulator